MGVDGACFAPSGQFREGGRIPRAALCGYAASLCPGLQMCKPVGLSIAGCICTSPWAINTDDTVPQGRTARYGVATDQDTISKSFNSSAFELEKMSSVVPTNRLDWDVPRFSLVGGSMDC